LATLAITVSTIAFKGTSQLDLLGREQNLSDRV